MRVDVHDLGPVTVLAVAGRLDHETVDCLAEAIRRQLLEGRVLLVADLSEVESTSSAGLGTLVSALQDARRRGGDFRLAAPRPNVHRILDLCGLTSILKQYDGIEEAVASFAA